jgi:hypothetical protein
MKTCRTTGLLLLTLCSLSAVANSQLGSTASDLSCWRGKAFRSRTAKTRTVESDGLFVYALTQAVAKHESDGGQTCSNLVQLFLSHDGKTYKKVFEDRREFHGLGIEILGWSPDKKRLLFQTSHWPYDSDPFHEFTALILYPGKNRPTQLSVNEAFISKFGDKCEFEARVQAWQDNHSVRVLISRTPETESYQQVFCVKKPTGYILDLESQQISEHSH